MKSTGKIVEGRFSHETETLIYLEVDGVQVQFKKEQLDLVKMKELNANYKPEPEQKQERHDQARDIKPLTLDVPSKKQKQINLGELAKQNELKKKKSLEEFEARQESQKSSADASKQSASNGAVASKVNYGSSYGSFLWKVEAAGGPLYLLGSIHAVNKSVYPLPAAMERAFLDCETLAVEVDILPRKPTYDPEEIFESYMETALYPEGETLQRHISKETYRLLMKEFERYDVDAFAIQRIRPWALASVISGYETAKAQLDPELGIDRHFLSRAKFRSKKVFELESMEFQAKLFGGFSDKEQEMYLLATLKDITNEFSKINTMLSAWRSGDIKTLESLINESYPVGSELGAFRKKILTERNKGMLQKIEYLMQEKGTDLVIVGAAHMLGDDGLVTLMRNKGYRIARQ
ncbi:MAG TPA: TraB/GumN family protein [Acidobacteriota bacterium]|nr:TraB/GumN family protein [Acidobacteriota bacterium]